MRFAHILKATILSAGKTNFLSAAACPVYGRNPASFSSGLLYCCRNLVVLSPYDSSVKILLPAVTRSVEAATAFAFLSAAACPVYGRNHPCDSVVKILLPAASKVWGYCSVRLFVCRCLFYCRNPVSFSSGGFTAGILLFFLRVIVLSKSYFLLPS